MKKTLAFFITVIASTVLIACGDNSPCGNDSELFGITFSSKTYNLKLNQPGTITTSITPESCRESVTLSTYTGILPTGMSFVNGNISGTPKVQGTSTFGVSIISVENYKSFGGSYPRSGVITVVVAP